MTIITDIFIGQIIYAIKGRKEKQLEWFLKRLASKAKGLKEVAMDMSSQVPWMRSGKKNGKIVNPEDST